ncbi:MAG: hypothetical protein ACE5J4_03480 [Candidatus Aenigmatarchaeota archaeon]
MPLFGKKVKKVKRIYIPVDLVQKYASQGLSESQIISRLEAQGFEPERIQKAIRIALSKEIKGEVPTRVVKGPTPMGEIPFKAPGEVPTYEKHKVPRHPRMGYPPERVIPPGRPQPTRFAEAPETHLTFERRPPQVFEEPAMGEITVEEIVEGIVAEKWEEFEERLSNFEKRDLQLQGQIEDIRKKITEIEKKMKEKEQTLLSRFGEFGESMDSIEGRIGSIERIFKDFIPELTENIKIMSEIVEKTKKK